jgi:ABC-type amino acid transport substrate-binding protein
MILAGALVLTACGDNGDNGGGTAGDLLSDIQARGEVVCGVNDAVPGFGVAGADGTLSGFDIDFCRVIAAAVLGDADAVDFVPLTAEARFTALQSGEIDVLVRNTTWTATRDGSEGAAFATTTFYDGQGMMVRADSGINGVDDMANTTVCVLSGTTTELNLESQFSARGLAYDALTFETTTRCAKPSWPSGATAGRPTCHSWLPSGPRGLTARVVRRHCRSWATRCPRSRSVRPSVTVTAAGSTP